MDVLINDIIEDVFLGRYFRHSKSKKLSLKEIFIEYNDSKCVDKANNELECTDFYQKERKPNT